MRIIGGYQDTRKNNEDFAITPFLFRVWVVSHIRIDKFGNPFVGVAEREIEIN